MGRVGFVLGEMFAPEADGRTRAGEAFIDAAVRDVRRRTIKVVCILFLSLCGAGGVA